MKVGLYLQMKDLHLQKKSGEKIKEGVLQVDDDSSLLFIHLQNVQFIVYDSGKFPASSKISYYRKDLHSNKLFLSIPFSWYFYLPDTIPDKWIEKYFVQKIWKTKQFIQYSKC